MRTMHTVVAVVGAAGGVGSALCSALIEHNNVSVIKVDGWDFEYDEQVEAASMYIMSQCDEIDPEGKAHRVLVNCVGVNYIEWFPDMDFAQFDRLMNINVRSHLLLVQYLLDNDEEQDRFFTSKTSNGALCEIISNASHVAMTNSAFYNASKAAQHMSIMSLAREIRKTHGVCVFGVSPNKLAGTGMSKYIEKQVPDLRGWTPEQAHQYQLAALPAGEETNVDVFGEFVAFLLSKPERHKYLTNTVIPYGG